MHGDILFIRDDSPINESLASWMDQCLCGHLRKGHEGFGGGAECLIDNCYCPGFVDKR